MPAHLPVFSTDFAAHTSHLEIAECRSEESCDQEPRTDILMLSLKAVPHHSHLMGLVSPQMSNPIALRGPCS